MSQSKRASLKQVISIVLVAVMLCTMVGAVGIYTLAVGTPSGLTQNNFNQWQQFYVGDGSGRSGDWDVSGDGQTLTANSNAWASFARSPDLGIDPSKAFYIGLTLNHPASIIPFSK